MKTDVLIAWPPTGAIDSRAVREENLSADE
jgi:hypothetical protein